MQNIYPTARSARPGVPKAPGGAYHTDYWERIPHTELRQGASPLAKGRKRTKNSGREFCNKPNPLFLLGCVTGGGIVLKISMRQPEKNCLAPGARDIGVALPCIQGKSGCLSFGRIQFLKSAGTLPLAYIFGEAFFCRLAGSCSVAFSLPVAELARFSGCADGEEGKTFPRWWLTRELPLPLKQFQFEILCISNHTACRFAEKNAVFPLALGSFVRRGKNKKGGTPCGVPL